MGTKLDRKDVKIFANNSDATLITEFRTESEDGSTASFSRDPDVIQNANYEQGWVENQNNLNTKIFGEDMNAVSYVQSYLLKYLYENGIPEWSSTTEYFEHSIARVDNRLFISLTDNNINNDPENTVGEWSEVPLSAINIITSGSGSSILNTSSGNNITLKSLSVDGYASLQDNGDQINIHVIGSGGIVDAYWGQIQGTLTNQADLVSALGAKQDNLTFDTPLSKDVNNEVSIPKATDSISGYLDATDFQTFAGKQDALSGFTHSYDTDADTAQIYPTATNSNIGTSTYPITNVNASNVNASAVTTTGNATVGGNLSVTNNIYAGVKISTNTIDEYSNVIGEGNRVEFTCDYIKANGLVKTSASGNYGGYIGTSDYPYNYSYIATTNTDKIQGLTTATSVETGASVVPDTDNTYDIGSNAKALRTVYAKKISLTSADESNAERLDVRARTKIWNGTNGVDFGYSSCSKAGTSYDIGTSANPFDNIYASKLVGGSAEINGTTTATNNLTFTALGKGVEFYNGSTSVGSIKPSGSSTINFNNTVAGISLKSATGNILDTTNPSVGTTIKSNGGTCAEFADAHVMLHKSMVFNTDNTYTIGTPSVGPKVVYSHAFTNLSDIKTKENIKEYDSKILDKLKSISPITYNFKNDKDKAEKLGFSAQDIKLIEPLCVSGEKNKKGEEENLGIDLYALCTLSIKAIKELNDKVEELEARIEVLEKGEAKK